MIDGRTVAIIGGGVAGLAAAAAFARRGAVVTVFETAEVLGAVGAGLQVTPNGAKVLAALGLSEQLEAKGLRASAVSPYSARRGKRLAQFTLQGQHYYFLHRADLISMLEGSCRDLGVTFELGARIEDPQTVKVDLVVGADGIHSVTRSLLNGADAAQFTGQVAWRALINAPSPAEARIWMAPGRHVVSYPLKGGMLNIVAVQERQTWAAEGWHHPDAPENLRAAFSDAAPALQDMLAKVEAPSLWGLFRHTIAPRWYAANKVLIGDAAHPTLPFLAQGANLALEDAYCLARCCAEAAIPEALARFQSLRIPRVTRAIAAANANARLYHLSGAAGWIAQSGLRLCNQVAPNLVMSRLRWLYEFDVTA